MGCRSRAHSGWEVLDQAAAHSFDWVLCDETGAAAEEEDPLASDVRGLHLLNAVIKLRPDLADRVLFRVTATELARVRRDRPAVAWRFFHTIDEAMFFADPTGSALGRTGR